MILLIKIINVIVDVFYGSIYNEIIYQIFKVNDEKLALGFQDFSDPG